MRISNKRGLLEEVKSKLLSQRFKITGQEYSQVWGVIAQIWQHVDVHNPSDEYDIIRLDIGA